MGVLVVDIGGSNLKLMLAGEPVRVKVKSGSTFTPQRLLQLVEEHCSKWSYDRITVGFPAPIRDGKPAVKPSHLGDGWIGFDLAKAFGRPLRILNDAALQGLGSYKQGRMLFLGLGTGLGASLVVPEHVIPLELCNLRSRSGETIEGRLCKSALKNVGREKWQRRLEDICAMLRGAFLPDEIVLGGGNAKFVSPVPPGCRIGDNRTVLDGGERAWEENPDGSPRWKLL